MSPRGFVTGSGKRLVFLVNLIAPYQKPIFDRLARRFPNLRVLISTPMEQNRAWKIDWEGLDVVVQKTVTVHRNWRHPQGFNEPLYLHLPMDTVQQLRRYRPDVIISWEMGARTMLAAVYRWLYRDSRLVVWAEFSEATDHGRGRVRKLIRTLLHRAIDGFLVTGESGARYLRSLGVPERKISKIVYTTEIARFAQEAQRDWLSGQAPVRRLLYVGQLIERKGLRQFLAVLSRWGERHGERAVHFTLAGGGPLRDELQSYPVPPNVQLFFRGEVDYEELPRVYADADTFVFPTLADTWGVVVNEAMASGLPVLGSEYGQAVSELVADGESGWTFHPDNMQETEDALDRCLNASPELLAHMSERARQAALRLTPEHVSDLVAAGILSFAVNPV